ncbi:MAG: hypothetical protein RMY36_010820 [Nostoc sp. SerVER01]|nr:hypothetical protein [Nostoc sp. SerVER01]
MEQSDHTQSCSVSYSQFNGVGVARRRHRLCSTTSLRSRDEGMRSH